MLSILMNSNKAVNCAFIFTEISILSSPVALGIFLKHITPGSSEIKKKPTIITNHEKEESGG